MTLRQAVQEAAKVMRKHPSLAGVLKPLIHQGRMTLKYRDAQLLKAARKRAGKGR